MILADTSKWIDHLRRSDPHLSRLLADGAILMHPFVLGELALGTLRDRDALLKSFQQLPRSAAATDNEVLHFITRHAIYGRGVGYVDAHLLASAQLSTKTLLWTSDLRLQEVAAGLSLAYIPNQDSPIH